ncbi:MAG: CpsD/CapB family tyrosine-protein kinase [Nitrospira sp. CG24A]|nr:MAG: CpsD/CapB family tyrosine-protein kinase [Nitrospira sp. CG24A]
MEELSHAIDQYKQSKNGTGARSDSYAGSRPIPLPIVYTRTRVVECQEDVLRRNRVLTAFERGAFADGYQLLRTQVLHRLRENHWNVLGVTSPRTQEGKTLTALNLAIALAMETTQTVLLIDADLKQPQMHILLGLGPCRGLADYVLGDAPLEDVLIHPKLGRLVVLPGGHPIQRSSEVLTSLRMSALITEIKHRYPARIVVVDLPPVLTCSDTLAFAPALDALLLVAGEGVTTRRDVEEALALVHGATPVLGTVLNQSGKSQGNLKAMRELATI